VNENGHARIGATQACLTRLHSHFMAQWEPGHGGTLTPSRPDSSGFRTRPCRYRAWRTSSDLAANSLRASIQNMPQRLRRALLVVSQAKHATLLCSAARECLFRGKILRDIFIRLRLVCRDNREGGEKSALLRGQSLGRMRSRRGYSLPPENGNRSDAFNCKALCLAFFLCNHLVSAAGSHAAYPA
jgi:hypothetical protein